MAIDYNEELSLLFSSNQDDGDDYDVSKMNQHVRIEHGPSSAAAPHRLLRVFVSFAWHDRRSDVSDLTERLMNQTNALGHHMFDVFCVEQRIADHLYIELAEIVKQCDIFLAFVDVTYQYDSNICKCELLYAMDIHKSIIVVKMSELSHGWLEVLMSDLPWLSFSKERHVEDVFAEIVKRISKMFAPRPQTNKLSISRPGTHKVQSAKRELRPVERIKESLSVFKARMRYSLYGFLLFEPEEFVDIKDLSIIWGMESSANDKARQLIDSFNSSIECINYDSKMERVMLQRLFYEAAILYAKEDWKLHETANNQIQFRIILGGSRSPNYNQPSDSSNFGEIILFQAARNQRRSLVERVIYQLKPDQLADVCFSKAKQSDMTFLHFLYHFSWDDDVEEIDSNQQNGCKHSYRLLLKVLLKLKQGGISFEASFKSSSFSLLSEPSRVGHSFLSDLMNDAPRVEYQWEREPLLTLLAKLRHHFEEELWQNQLLQNNKTSIEIISALKSSNITEIEALMTGISRQIAKKDAAMLAASRFGNYLVFKYLFQPSKRQADLRDESGRTHLMLAANNCHFPIVQLILEKLAQNLQLSLTAIDSKGRTAIMLAAHRGHLAIVKAILNKCGSNVSQLLKMKDSDGKTALALAVEYGHLEVVKELFYQYSYALNFVDNSGLGLLPLAARSGHQDVLELLLGKKKGLVEIPEIFEAIKLAAAHGHFEEVKCLSEKHPEALLEQEKTTGQTILMTAASHGHLDIVKFLLPISGDAVRQKDLDGSSALSLAASKGFLETVKCLYEIFPTAVKWHDEQFRRPLTLAALNGHLEIVKFLHEKFPEAITFIDSQSRNAFMYACASNQFKVAEYLFKTWPQAAVQFDVDGRSAFLLAAMNGCLATLKFLAEFCNIRHQNVKDNDGRTAFLLSALFGRLATVKYLLNDDASLCVDHSKQNALMLAAISNNVEVLKALYEAMPDPLQTDKIGRNPLMIAAGHDNLETVKFLAEIDQSSIEVQDKVGWTAMTHAAASGHVRVVEYLFEVKPETSEWGDLLGQTPMMVAASNGHFEMVKFFVERSRDAVRFRDKSDNTALAIAVAKSHFLIVEYLYPKYQYALNVRNRSGQTPLDIARQHGSAELVKFLEDQYKKLLDSNNSKLSLLKETR